MKVFAAILSAVIILLTVNVTSADLLQPDPYWKERQAIKDTISASIHGKNKVSISFKLPEECDYNCKICIHPNVIKKQYTSDNHFDSNGYRQRMYSYPTDEDIIEQFEGTYNGTNVIKKTFKYEKLEEGGKVYFPLIIDYKILKKETPFGSKMLQEPEKIRLSYMININRKDGKDYVKIFDGKKFSRTYKIW